MRPATADPGCLRIAYQPATGLIERFSIGHFAFRPSIHPLKNVPSVPGFPPEQALTGAWSAVCRCRYNRFTFPCPPPAVAGCIRWNAGLRKSLANKSGAAAATAFGTSKTPSANTWPPARRLPNHLTCWQLRSLRIGLLAAGTRQNHEILRTGGEGGIRTHDPLPESVTYRFLVAVVAIFAIPAVRHCSKLPKMAFARPPF